MAWGESNAPEARVTHSLDGDAGDNAQNGKDHKGEEVADDHDSQKEGNCGNRHGACAIRAVRAGAMDWGGFDLSFGVSCSSHASVQCGPVGSRGSKVKVHGERRLR